MTEMIESDGPMTRNGDGVVFKLHDTVRVVKESRANSLSGPNRTVGFWGFIDTFWEDENGGNQLIQLHCLNNSGRGSIPLDCIEHYDAPDVKQAKAAHDAEQERVHKMYEARAEQERKEREEYEAAAKLEMDRIAAHFKLPTSIFEAAALEFEAWRKEWRSNEDYY